MAGEADGEQEAERDLGAGDEGAQFLEQLAVFTLQPLFYRFILWSFPEARSIASSVATLVLPAGFRPGILR